MQRDFPAAVFNGRTAGCNAFLLVKGGGLLPSREAHDPFQDRRLDWRCLSAVLMALPASAWSLPTTIRRSKTRSSERMPAVLGRRLAVYRNPGTGRGC
jgi:hypothetical protein